MGCLDLYQMFYLQICQDLGGGGGTLFRFHRTNFHQYAFQQLIGIFIEYNFNVHIHARDVSISRSKMYNNHQINSDDRLVPWSLLIEKLVVESQ